jgi:hypothetical protein
MYFIFPPREEKRAVEKEEEEVQVERGVPLQRAFLEKPIPICLHNGREALRKANQSLVQLSLIASDERHIMRAGNRSRSLKEIHPSGKES